MALITLLIAFCAVTARLFVFPATGMPARVDAIVVRVTPAHDRGPSTAGPKGPTADRGYLLALSDEARAYPADLLPRGQLGQGYSALGETTDLGRIGGDRGVGQAVISV